MLNAEWGLGSVRCGVWSAKWGAQSVNCGMLSSVKRGVWGVECSGEWEVGSVKCRV